jgi:hypothetical protein
MSGARYEIAIDGTTRTELARSCDLPQEIQPKFRNHLARSAHRHGDGDQAPVEQVSDGFVADLTS